MSSKCVLIVATEGGETDELATYLEERGFQTEVASGEAEGLIELHQRQYDIVLIDADLPGLFLDEFVEAILAAHPSTKIIIITATERPSKLHRAVQSGVTCYARKPFDREWLSLQMEEL